MGLKIGNDGFRRIFLGGVEKHFIRKGSVLIYKSITQFVTDYTLRVIEDGGNVENPSNAITLMQELRNRDVFQDATFVMIPSGTKSGRVYSELNANGDLTFTRASTATRVNSAGLIEDSPRNLLPRTTTYASPWIIQGSTITLNTHLSPNGINEGVTYTRTSTTWSSSLICRLVDPLINTYTASIYVKYIDIRYLYILSTQSTNDIVLDLLNKNITKNSLGNFVSLDILPNDWMRVTWKRPVISGGNIDIIYLSLNSTPDSLTGISATGSCYIYGPQLEFGSTATDYVATTDRLNHPRIDYSSGVPALLLEPQMTNLFTLNNELNGYSSSANAVRGSIVLDAFGSGFNGINYSFTGGVTFLDFNYNIKTFDTRNLPVQRYSLFVKNPSSDFFAINISGTGQVIYQFSNLTVSDVNSGSIIKLNTNTYILYFFSDSSGGAQFSNFRIAFVTGLFNQNTINGSAIVGLAFYQGAASGSLPITYTPITTTASTVTRVGDLALKTGISDIIGQTEGTFVIDSKLFLPVNSLGTAVSLSNGTNNETIIILFPATTNRVTISVVNSNGENFNQNIDGVNLSNFIKLAIKWKSGEFKVFINGIQVYSKPTFNTFSNGVLSQLKYSRGDNQRVFEGFISRNVIYKTALTDAQCEALTGLSLAERLRSEGGTTESTSCVTTAINNLKNIS